MQVRGSRQTVTGLTVNEKVNTPQRYYKTVRAMTHSFVSSGSYKLNGANNTSSMRLEGMLNYIYHVRERQIDLMIEAVTDEEKRKKMRSDRTMQKNEYPSAIRLLYCQVVFFKHFIDPRKPLILCEGPTDIVYLKCAIRKLARIHPKLASVKAGKISLDVAFFKYSDQSKDLLQLRGGSSDLRFFLQAWKRNVSRYKFRPMRHPVIVLIDNDDGAKRYIQFTQRKIRRDG